MNPQKELLCSLRVNTKKGFWVLGLKRVQVFWLLGLGFEEGPSILAFGFRV